MLHWKQRLTSRNRIAIFVSTSCEERHNKSCNCRQKNTCPLNGNWLHSSVIYQATVKSNDNNTSETYIGLTENAFKTRYRSPTASIRHTKHRNSLELSKHVWSLKDNNIDYSISWRIILSSSSYNISSKRCNLCLKEKFLIICRPDLSSLNKRNYVTRWPTKQVCIKHPCTQDLSSSPTGINIFSIY